MSRLQFFWHRLVRMDWKAMWKTTGLLKKRSGKSRLWLLIDMLKCAVKYNAGYMDYKIAQMYKLNDEQRKTVITRGISNEIVRRMNPKAASESFPGEREGRRLLSRAYPVKAQYFENILSETEAAGDYGRQRKRYQIVQRYIESGIGTGNRKMSGNGTRKCYSSEVPRWRSFCSVSG